VIGRRKPVYVAGTVLALLGWSAMFYAPNLPLPGFIAIAALTSVASGAVVIGFAFAKESVPAQFLGTISGTTNIGNMIGPTLLQPAIGWIIGLHWTGKLVNGVHVYDVEAFRAGFVLMVGWLVLSSILLSLTKETHCKQSA
jgi:MFS family permease